MLALGVVFITLVIFTLIIFVLITSTPKNNKKTREASFMRNKNEKMSVVIDVKSMSM